MPIVGLNIPNARIRIGWSRMLILTLFCSGEHLLSDGTDRYDYLNFEIQILYAMKTTNISLDYVLIIAGQEEH
jgi:hypothetical protein